MCCIFAKREKDNLRKKNLKIPVQAMEASSRCVLFLNHTHRMENFKGRRERKSKCEAGSRKRGERGETAETEAGARIQTAGREQMCPTTTERPHKKAAYCQDDELNTEQPAR